MESPKASWLARFQPSGEPVRRPLSRALQRQAQDPEAKPDKWLVSPLERLPPASVTGLYSAFYNQHVSAFLKSQGESQNRIRNENLN